MILCKWRARKQISLLRDNKIVLYCMKNEAKKKEEKKEEVYKYLCRKEITSSPASQSGSLLYVMPHGWRHQRRVIRGDDVTSLVVCGCCWSQRRSSFVRCSHWCSHWSFIYLVAFCLYSIAVFIVVVFVCCCFGLWFVLLPVTFWQQFAVLSS